jgi:clan AA aspartic protease
LASWYNGHIYPLKRRKIMGHTYAKIRLANSVDAILAKRGNLPNENVRKMEVTAMVDSGARTLTINEEIAKQLGLEVEKQLEVVLADGSYRKCDYVGPVNIYFENRFSCVHALVLPGADEILLGVIPLEEMDVIIDPLSEKLVVHPDRPHGAQMKVK